MSTAANTTSPNITHLPHTPHTPHAAHPLSLREHAFALHCQGLRSPAIAAELGVSERTIRAWIAAALDELKDDLQLNRREQLLLAVERQNQFTATAWQQFHQEAAARDALLDAALDTLLAATNSSGASAQNVSIRLPASTPAPRYLSLIIQANKEINRLLGLYTLARLQLLTPDVSQTDPATPTYPDIPAESATATIESQIAAKTATGISSLPVGGARGGASDDGGAERAQSEAVGQWVRSLIPAESATGSPAAADCVGASAGRPVLAECAASDIPAESATGISPRPAGSRFRPQPVSGGHSPEATGEGRTGAGGKVLHTNRKPQPWMM